MSTGTLTDEARSVPEPDDTSRHTYRAAASLFGKSARMVLHELAGLLRRLAARDCLVTEVNGSAAPSPAQTEHDR